MAKKKNAKKAETAKGTIKATSKVASKEDVPAIATKKAKDLLFGDVSMESVGDLFTLGKNKVVQTLLSTLVPAESQRAISRLPIGNMVQRTIDHFSNRDQPLPMDNVDVIHVDNWSVEKRELERLIDTADFLPASFLVEGARKQAAVARIRLKQAFVLSDGKQIAAGSGWGTGFLVSASLLLTNNHVIPDKEFAKSFARMQFNFQNGSDGALLSVDEFDFDPDSFFLTSPENKLDYSLIRVKENDGGMPGALPVIPGAKWGSIPLIGGKIAALGQKVNIVQHPDGRPKEVILHQNEVTDLFPDYVRYRADTEPGSSGSPVFSNSWELVALHHAGGKQDESKKWLNNEGVRIDRIIADIKAKAPAISIELRI